MQACNPLKPQEDPTRFYFLRIIEESDDEEVVQLDISIGVGPVHITPYLNRRPIATRVGDNELKYSQIDRWAEPLGSAVPFILTQNLEYLLGPDDIEVYPWYGADRMDYVVKLDLLGFHRTQAGDAELHADWDIEDAAGRDLHSGFTEIVVPATDNTTEASVYALGLALSDLSRQIAAAIRELEATRQTKSR